MITKRVFAIGNGESRKSIDLNKLRPYGIIYGCNALYRDFQPDALVVVDPKMKEEIWKTDYLLKNKAYFKDWSAESPLQPGQWGFKATPAFQFLELEGEDSFKKVINSNSIVNKKFPNDTYRIGYSSGPASVLLACIEEEPSEVFLIGHDLYSPTGRFNNVYKDTENYVGSDTQETPCSNWITQLKWCFKDFNSIEFYMVEPLKTVDDWDEIKNIHYITFDEMLERLNR